MPLYDATLQPNVAPEDALKIVHQFLTKCHGWASAREIPKRLKELESSLDKDQAAKLHEWIAYLRFTEHTIRELEDGTLDHWFSAAQAKTDET